MTPSVTITGNLQDLTGAANVGSLNFELVNFGTNVPRITGTSILAQISNPVISTAGSFSITLWGNDVITPSGTYYNVSFFNSSGGLVATIPYLFTGSGSFDISNLAPLVTTPTTPIPSIGFPNVTGNIAVSQMNNGTGATTSTFWRGDGTWAAPTTSGSVTNVGLSMPSIFTVTGSPVTTSGTLTATLVAQAQNTILSGPTSGANATPTFRALVGADLPVPSATTLGGVKSLASVSHKFLTSIGTDGTPVSAQPAAADLSDGTTGSGNVVLANTPTLITPSIGAATGTSLALTGIVTQDVTNCNVTPVTVTATTSQTVLQSVTMLSGELNKVGRSITVRVHGVMSTGATAGTWSLALKIGTTTLYTFAPTPGANVTNSAWFMDIDIGVQTAGATGALEVQGFSCLTGVSAAAVANTASITSIDLTGSPAIAMFVTANQTTTSTTSRLMIVQRNN
jgi:hypothetical protein